MASYQTVEHTTNRKSTPTMKVLDDATDDGKTPRASVKVGRPFVRLIQRLTSQQRANVPKPLQTNTLGNLQATRSSSKASQFHALSKHGLTFLIGAFTRP